MKTEYLLRKVAISQNITFYCAGGYLLRGYVQTPLIPGLKFRDSR